MEINIPEVDKALSSLALAFRDYSKSITEVTKEFINMFNIVIPKQRLNHYKRMMLHRGKRRQK